MSKLYFTCPPEGSEQKWESFWENIFSIIFVILVKIWHIVQKNFKKVVKPDFKVSGGTYWGKTFFEIFNFFSFSVLSYEYFSASRQKHFVRVVKKAFHGPGERVECFFWKNSWLFHRLRTFSNNILDFWRKNFSSVSKIELCVSKGTLNVLRRNFFSRNKNCFFLTSTFSANLFRKSGGNNPAGLSEPQFTSTEERFDDFFCKTNFLFIIFVPNLQKF